MPQIDPKTGKQLSGAKKRAAAKKRTGAYKAAVAAVAAVAASAPPTDQARTPNSADFAAMPPAPLGNPAEAVAWVNDLMLVALDQVIRDPSLDGNNLERWRQIKEFGKALGMIQAKASEQHRLKTLAERAGLTMTTTNPPGSKPLASINKPPTARRS